MGEVRPTVDSQDEVGLNLASLVVAAPVGAHRHDEGQVIAIHIAQHREHGVITRGAVAEHHGMLHQLGQALHLLHGESVAVGVVVALRADGIAQVALGVEHGQRAEARLHEQLRRIAELDRAGTGIFPASDGIDLIAEAKVLRALRGMPHVFQCLIVAVFQMHPAARVEVGDALALGHRHRVLVLADGQDDLSLVHLIWHMASFLCGLIVSNMYS